MIASVVARLRSMAPEWCPSVGAATSRAPLAGAPKGAGARSVRVLSHEPAVALGRAAGSPDAKTYAVANVCN
ncbi:hypothetical protein GCM10023403_60900 [Pseudonocardia benzenivorans]|nr:hypothetical protein PSD17_28070 [Pseudonocardia sp. D17]